MTNSEKQNTTTEELRPMVGVSLPPVDLIDRFELNPDSFYKSTVGFHYDHISAIAVEYLKQETGFVMERGPGIKPVLPLDEEERRLVGTGQMKCPLCQGYQEIERLHRGRDTGIRTIMPIPCFCKAYKAYSTRWEDPLIVPSDYRKLSLEKLHQVREFRDRFKTFKSKGTLDKLFGVTDVYRSFSYLLTGNGGTGKSTLMTALYQDALGAWAQQGYQQGNFTEAVWKTDALRLSKQFQAWSLRDMEGRREDEPIDVPIVTPNKVKHAIKAGFQPCLFIEEIDKYKHSEFQNREFFAVLEAIHANGGQIVATSNITDLQLKSSLGAQFGESIVRRIMGLPRGILVDFDKGSITLNIDEKLRRGLPEQTPKETGGTGEKKVQAKPGEVAPALDQSQPKLPADSVPGAPVELKSATKNPQSPTGGGKRKPVGYQVRRLPDGRVMGDN
jgi:hypothetical protein